MIKKILIWMVGIIGVLLIGATAAFVATQPAPPPANSISARWLTPGPHAVLNKDLTFTDTTRPTSANGEFSKVETRTLNTTMWYPDKADGKHPLVIYSHGFMSNRRGGEYIAENLASHGYVVIAPDYPLTHGGTPGGPLVTDVVNQPGDVSFLIDSIMALSPAEQPFEGEIDSSRIGVAGISLGGLTATLAAFHPRLRDPRVKAAVSIAGPANMFTPAYFATADLPFLMIAGTIDAIVDYSSNAIPIPQRVKNGALLSIEGGAHTSFVAVAEPAFRWMGNPDSLGCTAILANVTDEPVDVFAVLGDLTDGIVTDPNAPALCSQNPLPESIHPGRQHMMTQIAVTTFFQAQFAHDEDVRKDALKALNEGIAADFTEASFRR